MPRAALPLAFAACLHLVPGSARAQSPVAAVCTAPLDATAQELATRLRLCSHALAVAEWRIAILEKSVADLIASLRVGEPNTPAEPKEAR